MVQPSSREIEGSHQLALPSHVLTEAREYADQSELTLRGFIDGAHVVMWQIGQIGVSANTLIHTPNGLTHLPRTNIEPQPITPIATIIGKRLLEQSFEYRQARKLSISQYVSRALVLTNGLFRLDVGPQLRLERTLAPPHRASIVLPYNAHKKSETVQNTNTDTNEA